MCQDRKKQVSSTIKPVGYADGRIRFRKHSICSGERNVFENPQPNIELDNSDRRGSFLCMELPKKAGVHNVSLGTLHCDKFLAASRQNLWRDVHPSWAALAKDVPSETQFLLARLSNPAEREEYMVILPLLNETFRTSLDAGANGTLVLKLDCCETALLKHKMEDLAFVAVGPDPFKLVHASFSAVSERLKTFRLRELKTMPKSLDMFGWCTWGAMASKVDGPGIMRGIEMLTAGGAPPRSIMIDDGWQDSQSFDESSMRASEVASSNSTAVAKVKSNALLTNILSALNRNLAWPAAKAVLWYFSTYVETAGVGSVHRWLWRQFATLVDGVPFLGGYVRCFQWPRSLRSCSAGDRFLSTLPGHSLSSFVHRLKEHKGVRSVTCWYPLMGYWSGAPFALYNQAGTVTNNSCPPSSSSSSSRSSSSASSDQDGSLKKCASIGARIAEMYSSLNASLAACSVDSVKVAAQGEAAMLGKGRGGSTATTRKFVRAMEKSVVENFGSGASAISTTSHPIECLYAYQDTAIARAAAAEATDARGHVVAAAFSSLFIGEIVQPDWDAFQSTGRAALMQAAARAVGGCAVTVSDEPGHHDFNVLRKVVLSDGSVLRATLPGRPTRDSLFNDVTSDGLSALKVWNRNKCNGVVAAFNCQGASWNQRYARYQTHDQNPAPVEAVVRPTDVEGLEGPEGAAGAGGGCFAMRGRHWSAEGRLKEGRVVVGGCGGEGEMRVRLEKEETLVCTVARVHEGRKCCGKVARWAVFGLEGMLNGGGSILEEGDHKDEKSGWYVDAKFTVKGHGTLLMWCEQPPTCVQTDGEEVTSHYDAEACLLRVPFGSCGAASTTFQVRF